jgi:hypothetical protein
MAPATRNDPASVIAAGHRICSQLDQGMGVKGELQDTVDQINNNPGSGLQPVDALSLLGSAVAVFCPKYTQAMVSYVGKLANGG